MKHILIYADSLSWGIIPNTRQRLPFTARWPGVLELHCAAQGLPVRVEENCLNGRRTVWADPLKDGRDGAQGLAQVIEMHAPLDVVILMLGTNDFQASHQNNAWLSSQGIAKLINIIRQAPIEPGMPQAQIVVVAPPKMQEARANMRDKFAGGEHKSEGLAAAFAQVAQEQAVHFFDANRVITTSAVDGVHLDQDQHLILGQAVANFVLVECFGHHQ